MELSGSEEEIRTTFTSVDVNGSGLISLDEFVKAFKSSRMEELSNRVLIMALEEEFGSIENFLNQSKGGKVFITFIFKNKIMLLQRKHDLAFVQKNKMIGFYLYNFFRIVITYV